MVLGMDALLLLAGVLAWYAARKLGRKPAVVAEDFTTACLSASCSGSWPPAQQPWRSPGRWPYGGDEELFKCGFAF